MAFGIDVKGMKDQLKTSFDEMMAELRAIKDVLMQILAELQKEEE